MNSSCSIKVQLDRPKGEFYTNLDVIKGKVIVTVVREISVENIQVKLEGLSNTSVTKRVRKMNGDTMLVTREEKHELIYDCDTLFPPDNIKKVTKNSDGFTLIPGVYAYDFHFQFPMNSYCSDPNSVKQFSNLYNSPEEKGAASSITAANIRRYGQVNTQDSAQGSAYSAKPVKHLLTPLPPSTGGRTGLNNSFDIRYFLKVTVRRSSMFKTNPRLIVPLNFTNFEPDDLTIARYVQNAAEITNRSKEYILNSDPSFGKIKIPFFVDIRFTDKIIRPNQSPSMSILLVSKVPPSKYQDSRGRSTGIGTIYIKKLTVTLVRAVHFRAQEFTDLLTRNVELRNLQRVAKLDLAKANQSREGLYEVEFPPAIFEKMKIPDAEVPPSFTSCNITNTYVLQVHLELTTSENSRSSQKLDFSTEVWVLSGSPPPFPVGTDVGGVSSLPPPPSIDYVPPSGAPPQPSGLSAVTGSSVASTSSSSVAAPASHVPATPVYNIQENNNSDVTEYLPTYQEATK